MELSSRDQLIKGTTTVGIVCKDGIVLVADKRASAGYRIVDKKAEKLHRIADNMAVAMAGLVSDAQLIIKLARSELMLKKIRSDAPEITVKEGANLIANILYSNIRKPSMIPGIVGFLLGGKDSTGYYLYDLGIDGSISMHDDYVSDGSGSDLVIGVLEATYKRGLPLTEGINLAVKAISAAIARDMPTGNGIDIITISDKGVSEVMNKPVETKIII
ncbi:proteasome subunit beta [Candidatus Woesearchaeota archaeon]|nr:proteasome subunit beta [Candidatus Woesearchaeota archaeon]